MKLNYDCYQTRLRGAVSLAYAVSMISANRNNVDERCISGVGCGSLLRSHTYAYDAFGHGVVTTACAEITAGVASSDQYVQISVSSVHAVVIHSYDAFGNPLATENSERATLLSFRFSTTYLDPETGFYYYGYRYYDPELGRWLTRDPLEEQGGLNLYGFCGNDAVNKWDKLGNRYNPFTHCCIDGTVTSRKPIKTGVRLCKKYNRVLFGKERPWLLQHAWIEIGAKAIGFNDLNEVNFDEFSYYGQGKCEDIMLSPCLYETDSFKETVIQTAGSWHLPYNPYCNNCLIWANRVIEASKEKVFRPHG